MNINELSRRIISEFSTARPPKSNEIALENDWDADAINYDFSKFLLRPVDESILENHDKSLAGFTPEAFAYFVKDYMLYTINHIDEIESAENELIEHMIFRFSNLDTNDKDWQEIIRILTPRQIGVILEFLKFLKKELLAMKNNVDPDYYLECLDVAITAWGNQDKGQ